MKQTPAPSQSQKTRRILGIDPGLRLCGWGIIQQEGSRLTHVANGLICPDTSLPFSQRLHVLHQGLVDVIQTHNPTDAAVEITFVNTNAASTLKLGMARGVILLAPAQFGLSVGEYEANKIKKTIVGAGHADKTQIQAMVKYLLPGVGDLKPDQADALATAITHAQYASWERDYSRSD